LIIMYCNGDVHLGFARLKFQDLCQWKVVLSSWMRAHMTSDLLTSRKIIFVALTYSGKLRHGRRLKWAEEQRFVCNSPKQYLYTNHILHTSKVGGAENPKPPPVTWVTLVLPEMLNMRVNLHAVRRMTGTHQKHADCA